MPDPKKYKDKDSFMDACIPQVMEEEGTEDQDHAVAKCNGMWENKEKKSHVESGAIERRFVSNDVAEVRLKEEKDKPTKIVGYFAKFNKLSRNLGGFKEKIEPGFFAEALKTSDTVDLFNHDSNYILGRKSAGTLRLWEDKTGLAYECDAPTTQLIEELVLSPIRRGDIKGNSFGFMVNGDGDVWDEDDDGRVVRTLKKNGCRELIDGSQVVNPAYIDTAIALRSMEKWQEKVKAKHEEKDIKFKVIDEPKEDKSSESITIHINAIDAESFAKYIEENQDELINGIRNAMKRKENSDTSDVEPMQGEEESKDDLVQVVKDAEIVDLTDESEEHSELMQGDEVRDYWKINKTE